jgi:hypothetical protein
MPTSYTIDNRGRQVAFEITPKFQPVGGLCERNETIVHNVLGGGSVVQKSRSQPEQIVFVLFIDSAEGIITAVLKFPYKQLVFYQLYFVRFILNERPSPVIHPNHIFNLYKNIFLDFWPLKLGLVRLRQRLRRDKLGLNWL